MVRGWWVGIDVGGGEWVQDMGMDMTFDAQEIAKEDR
jgi:hypothetical protein